MKKEEARLSQIMKQLIWADEIDVAEGLIELGNLFPKLRDWDYRNILRQLCWQVGTLLGRNVIDDSVTFRAECFDFLMDASPDFERAMLCRSFQDVIRDLANLELSDREELPETIKMLETHRGSFQGERGRTRLFPWERGMEIMIRRWIVACKRRGRCPPREPIPRPKVRLRAPGLRHFRGRSEFAMFVELDIGTAVNNDFPLLYGVDIHLDDNAPGDLYHGQQVYELSRLDNVIAYVRVDPTPGELKLGVSESGRLRESLENIPYRALTLVLQKVSSKDFVAQARAVCEEMQIPAKSPWLLVQNPLSPFATNPSLKGQYLSVETKFMTRTGPMAPKEARFSLRVGGD